MNENYAHPAMPEGAAEGIIKGCISSRAEARARPACSSWDRGTILREVIAAADLLRDDWKIESDIWSATSFNELRRDGMSAERHNLLHPKERAARATSRPH